MKASPPSVLILGGGVAGLAAAQTLDACGISVHLVEQAESLGGKAFEWACMATDTCQSCGACLAAELVDKTAGLTRTTVHLKNSLAAISKNSDGFAIELTDGSAGPVRADAVLLATGLTPFDPSAIEDLGYGIHDRVITTVDLNAILKQEALSGIFQGNKAPAVAFIQCVGSRDREQGRDYCSQVCCKTAVRQANKILHEIPGAAVSVFHIDLQVIGKAFRTQAAQMSARVKLLQGVPAKILSDLVPDKLSVIREDPESGARQALHFDLIVLAVGIQPAGGISAISEQLGAKAGQWGFFGADPVVLPEGVYAAGNALGPNDILTSRDQGIIAAHKIAAHLGCLPQIPEKPNIVVFGGSSDSHLTAKSLAADGYPVQLLDPFEQAGPQQSGITHFPGARLTAVEGTTGQYGVCFTSSNQRHRLTASAIVVASGIQLASAAVSTDNKRVLPLSEFADAFAKAPGSQPDTIVFWLDRIEPEWKAHARRCLSLSLAQAEKGGHAVVVMEKMLVHGLKGQQLYDEARRKGVRFLRMSNPDQVTVETGDRGLRLTINEATLPGIRLTIDCDLLVVPEPVKNPPLATEVAAVLRQERDVEGFLQSANVRHRPIGSPRRGIFFIGACHAESDEIDVAHEIESLKAALAMLANREFDLDRPPVIDKNQCVRCLTCYRVCPHAAVILRNHYQPEIVDQACFGCGLCVTNCPALAIAPAQTIDLEKQGKAGARTIVFACERSAGLALKAAEEKGISLNREVEVIPVRCAGSLDEITLLQLVAGGADKVIVAGCHEGNCRSMAGSGFAAARANKIAADMGSADGRIKHQTVAANEPSKMAQILAADGSRKEVS